MKKHILIVEDDPHIRMGLHDAFVESGYEVSECGTGTHALPMLKERKPDILLLDVMLPGKNGFDLCREIRASKNNVLILMLSAKGQEIDKVLGLELGADDYMTKPFSIRELLAKVHAMLRRKNMDKEASDHLTIPTEFNVGPNTIHAASMKCIKPDGTSNELSMKELQILALLHRELGNVVDRNKILDIIWGREYYGTTRTLDQVIVKLRQKIERDPSAPELLLTVHGVGYRLAALQP